jgi:hypothetical protein
MGNKIKENSESISFFIELCVFLFVGIVIFNFFFGLLFKYITNTGILSHSKFIKVSYTSSHTQKKVILTSTEKSIQSVFSDLISNSSDISNRLTQSYKDSLSSEYKNNNYSSDIESSLGIYTFSNNINFVNKSNNSYLIYLYIGKSKLYLRVYFQKDSTGIKVSGILPSES